MTCRSVNDMGVLFTTGDISGGDWAKLEFEGTPWEDPEYFREISPLTYADRIRTPLLIQHSERDIRTTIAQAEALFTVLRTMRRPVRLLRVPEENHELTRSGTPYRRIENLRIVESLVPPLPDRRQARPAAAPQGPRRALASAPPLRRPRCRGPCCSQQHLQAKRGHKLGRGPGSDLVDGRCLSVVARPHGVRGCPRRPRIGPIPEHLAAGSITPDAQRAPSARAPGGPRRRRARTGRPGGAGITACARDPDRTRCILTVP